VKRVDLGEWVTKAGKSWQASVCVFIKWFLLEWQESMDVDSDDDFYTAALAGRMWRHFMSSTSL
jgi:hypothetical protein